MGKNKTVSSEEKTILVLKTKTKLKTVLDKALGRVEQ